MDFLEKIDLFLLHYLNYSWRNDFLDNFVPYLRTPKVWIPLYLFFLYYLFNKMGKKSGQILLYIVLSVGAADATSSHIVKPLFHRLRPCNEANLMQEVINIVPCGSGFSFTSSHAANHFALAMALILSVFYDKKHAKWLLLFWASSVAYAQVYVGVHYPLDVISGAILGVGIALFFNKIRIAI